jgi:hypothetical protein
MPKKSIFTTVTAIAAAAISFSATPANAVTYMIGDNDGYGAGIPDNAPHPPFNPGYDGRSAAEMAATDGAQYTDTYSTAHPGFSVHGADTTATFIFSGLTDNWTEGAMIFDLADFQAAVFGALVVRYNGIAQNWAFDDGYPNTAIHSFNFGQDVLDSINLLDSLTITMDRNGSGDFYGVDYAKLSSVFVGPGVPEPTTWAMTILGFGFIGGALRNANGRRRQQTSVRFAL